MTTSDVRSPAVAGHFYPAEPSELRNLVRRQLDEVADQRAPAFGAIVPHAGLVYSGACAARVFRQVRIPPVTVLIGPNHRGRTAGRHLAGAWAQGFFETPLGRIRVATDFAAALLDACPLIAHDPVAHADEHSLEVELPFLQGVGSETAIVPILLATDKWEFCKEIADALTRLVRGWEDEVLVLASSDMTHYEPAESAERKDRFALDAIEKLDAELMLSQCWSRHISMCGRSAAAVAIEAARQLGAQTSELVDYRHSGWVTGDDSSVVAYAGIVIR